MTRPFEALANHVVEKFWFSETVTPGEVLERMAEAVSEATREHFDLYHKYVPANLGSKCRADIAQRAAAKVGKETADGER